MGRFPRLVRRRNVSEATRPASRCAHDDLDSIVILDAGTGTACSGRPCRRTFVESTSSCPTSTWITSSGLDSSPAYSVQAWKYTSGDRSTVLPLRARLTRDLSPPLFPVRLRDVPCRLTLHDVPLGTFEVPGASVTAALVCHPGPTVGYRLDDETSTLVYLSDHEPALGARRFPICRVDIGLRPCPRRRRPHP